MTAQSEYLVPTSELQAVNVLLEAISQVPVTSLLDEDVNTDANVARKRLYESSRTIQSDGWHFNQEIGFIIDPATDGSITLPSNTLRVVRWYFSGLGGDEKDLVHRGARLYDRIGHTFNIGVSVKVDLTVLLPFDELVEAFRWYVTVAACRRFVAGRLHSATSYQFTRQEELDAMRAAEQADAETDERTLEGNPAFRRMRMR